MNDICNMFESFGVKATNTGRSDQKTASGLVSRSNSNLASAILQRKITKGSSRGATLSFTLRSKGEGGQPGYLIHQEIASHFSTPPSPPPPPPLFYF